MKNKRILLGFVWLLLGITLFSLGLAGIVDEFWSGMGSGFLGVGVLQMIRFYRFHKDETYRMKVETESTDERNHFIRNKAWAWTGYLFTLTASVSVIVFRLIGQDLLSTAASYAVCLILLLFWGTYHILQKKY